MRLIDMVCPHCGANLNVDAENKTAACEHCGAMLFIDDEVQRPPAENAGGAKKKPFLTTRTIVYLAVLVALEIVLNRFLSINTPVVKIGFSFVPIAVAGILFGPIPAAIVAALADLLGAFLFPTGTIFLGITLTAFLKGISWGLFLHKKQTPLNIVLAVLVDQIILSYILNSFWLSILMGAPYASLLATRIVQTAILIPVEFVVIFAISKALGRYGKRLFA